jgi:hypothetical protein
VSVDLNQTVSVRDLIVFIIFNVDDFLGGTFMVGLNTSLQFKVFKCPFEMFRSQLFINTGYLSSTLPTSPNVSCGLGFLANVGGSFSVEINYCWNLVGGCGNDDFGGFQFGIGVDVL